MDTTTILSILAFILAIGAIGYIFSMNRTRYGQKKRFPLEDMLKEVKEAMVQADLNAQADHSAIMKFSECAFEFAIETENDASGKLTVFAVELSGGAKLTESNKVSIKYIGLPDHPIVGVEAEQ